jgi:putative CocE/NonD family hydrolase
VCDVSVGPNLALYNHVRASAPKTIADEQWAVIAPVLHCSYTRATADTVVGERSMGDARLDYNDIVYGFFDRFLKGEKTSRIDTQPKVTYYTMGLNKWQTAETWPPAGAQPLTFYLGSGGWANTLNGDGALSTAAPDADKADAFTYDPMNPVLSRRQRLLHRERRAGRLMGSTADGSARGHPGLHDRCVPGRDRSQRTDSDADALRLIRREGHRLHGEGADVCPDGRAF